MRGSISRSAYLMGAGMFALAVSHGAALAQTATPEQQAQVAEAATDEAIVITGSRLITNGNSSPMPVSVVSNDELMALSPGSVAGALQNLPVFQNSLGQGSGTGGGVAGSNGGANAVNIRNLGLSRSLVLFNGKRVQPSTSGGVVTIDMIPQMLLSRVDIVTGGVSAVYGSDAISGVVNFVTDRTFTGVELKAQSGISQHGDGQTIEFGAAVGTSLFGGRGHFQASLEYMDDRGAFDMFKREHGQLWQIQGSGRAASPFRLVSDVRNAALSFGGLISTGPFSGQHFRENGVLTPFVHGTATGSPGFESGGDGTYFFNTSLKGALQSKRGYGRFDFDLTDSVQFFAEAFVARNRNRSDDSSLTFRNLNISAENAFLAPEYRAALTPGSTFRLSIVPQLIGPHRKDFEMESEWFNAGFTGKLGSNFRWEVTGNHGRTKEQWITYRNINFKKLYSALDAVSDGRGGIACQINMDSITTNDDSACQPLNFFGPSAASAAALDYITDRTVNNAYSYLDQITASITGELFRNWAGPVNVAVSGEWRKARYSEQSPFAVTGAPDCTGVRFNSCARLRQVNSANVAEVSQTVREAALELDLPLLADSAIAQRLNLNLAARYADYSISGSAETWKVGLDWQVVDGLRLRATRSRDFRAPTLLDLFNPATLGRENVVDQLTNVSLINVLQIESGNKNLKPEIGNTMTLGVVYRPNWAPNFSLSVDYYDISIKGAISALAGTNISVQRACIESAGSSPLCALIERPGSWTDTSAANSATGFFSQAVNAAEITTRGVDAELNYTGTLAGRPLSVRVLTTYQPYLLQETPGLERSQRAGYAYSPVGAGSTPKFRATTMVSYEPVDQVRTTLSYRWRSGMKWNADETFIYDEPDISPFGILNLNVSFMPEVAVGRPELFVNVQNLLDAKPPIAINSSADTGRFGAYIRGDDYLGRYITVGAKVKF